MKVKIFRSLALSSLYQIIQFCRLTASTPPLTGLSVEPESHCRHNILRDVQCYKLQRRDYVAIDTGVRRWARL